jgi:hypothetical protein
MKAAVISTTATDATSICSSVQTSVFHLQEKRSIDSPEDTYLARLDKNPEATEKTYQNYKSEGSHGIPPLAFFAFSTD